MAVQSCWVPTISRLVPTSVPTSYSGKKKIKVLHRLGQCFMLPGVDFMSYEYAGSTFPDSSSDETVCKWCAKSKDFHSDPDSLCSNTSSSSEEEKRTRSSICTLRSPFHLDVATFSDHLV